jgi:hypothetical protein
MSLPEMNLVSSSNIESIGYDGQNELVYVRFLNGSLYVYKGVPMHEYNNLMQAPSLGSYLHRNYKNVYIYERIQ